ncbi:MAG: hypothetical protein L0207_00025 [Chlamydiae bacterium]|nr:hypothetical protein [Chlamydiota bacterium]
MEKSVQTTSIVQPTAAVSGSQDGQIPDLMKISTGQAALVQDAIYQAMDMYRKIVELDAEQRQNAVNVQVEAALASADAVKASADAAGKGMIISGSLSIGGAAVNYGITNVVLPSSNLGKTSGEMATLEKQAAPLKKLDEFQLQAQNQKARLRDGGEELEAPSTQVGKRIDALKQGVLYEKQENIAHEKVWYAPWKTTPVEKTSYNIDEDLDEEALKHIVANPEDAAAFKSELNRQLDQVNRELNTHALRMSNFFTERQVEATLAKTLFEATGSAVQGKYTMVKGNEDAKAEIYRTQSTIMNSAQQDFGQGMGTAGNEMSAEINQILSKIQESQKV